jgi:hypothetical protein
MMSDELCNSAPSIRNSEFAGGVKAERMKESWR